MEFDMSSSFHISPQRYATLKFLLGGPEAESLRRIRRIRKPIDENRDNACENKWLEKVTGATMWLCRTHVPILTNNASSL